MNVKIEYNKKVYEINSNHGQSISISMNFNSSNNPKFYDESNPINEPYTSNNVTYDINKNAGCNVPVVKFNVHCSGTHTETGAHIFKRSKTIGQGVAYSFSTLPNREWSNLGEGFVLVPILIRIFSECTENPSLNLSECGDSTSLKQNGLVPVTGSPNHKPSVKAGIYKNLGKFLAFNRKATESQNEILNKEKNFKGEWFSHVNL